MERFGNIISSARFHGENSILNFCITGHDDERNGVIVFFEPLQESESIMIREPEVGQDQVPVTVVFKKNAMPISPKSLFQLRIPFFLSHVCIMVPKAKSSSTINILAMLLQSFSLPEGSSL